MNWLYIVEAIGAIGAVEILVAYGLNSYQKIRSDSFLFTFLNLTGALLLIIYSVYKQAWASMFINVVWVVIAIIAMGKFFTRNETGK